MSVFLFQGTMNAEINLFGGGFIITMSHLPGRVLNFKIPRAPPFY